MMSPDIFIWANVVFILPLSQFPLDKEQQMKYKQNNL